MGKQNNELKIMVDANLIDTQTGISLIYISAFMPLSFWLMRNYFKTIPNELDESAMVDGASRLRALWTILPLTLPGVITEFSGRYTMDYGMITAAGIITMIPPVLIVLFFNKFLISGLMDAAVKE